jgi:AcrR family transcriptional regulator
MKKLPEDITTKLLNAVNEFPEASGFDVSVDDVARISGVPRATLYYYFSGRDDLIQFYLNDLMDRTATAISKAAASEGSAPERLANIMRSVVGSFSEYPRMCIEMAAAFKASDDHAQFLGNIDRTVMVPLRATLSEGSEAGELTINDAEMTAAAIMGALHQTSLTKLVFTGTIDADEITDLVIPMLMKGVLPR